MKRKSGESEDEEENELHRAKRFQIATVGLDRAFIPSLPLLVTAAVTQRCCTLTERLAMDCIDDKTLNKDVASTLGSYIMYYERT